MRVALYTAVYGDSDWVKPVPDVEADCFYFTESAERYAEAVVKGWTPILAQHYVATVKGAPSITAPMLAHKWWKTHPELACRNYDASIWIDGSIEINVTDFLERCLEALGDDDWSAVPHPARRCIYPEADFSATLTWRYDSPSILAQARFYREVVGHPANWGLFATGCCIRRHTSNVIELGEQWWQECINWSHQDQISLPVLLRLAEDKVKWNSNLKWHLEGGWRLHEHGRGVT